MKNKRKLKSVIKHEYRTIVQQPSFWISLLAVPVIFLVIFGISYLSSRNAPDLESQRNEAGYQIVARDDSGLVLSEVAEAANVSLVGDKSADQLRQEVSDGQLDAAIIYPEQITEDHTYQIFLNTDDEDPEKSNTVRSLGAYLLQQSLLAPLGSPEVAALALSGASAETVEFADGQPKPGLEAYIVPGAFMLLFYFALFMGIGYAATSVSEEKENRAFEMVLSYVRPRTLMVGKLFGTTLVTLTQILFYAVLAAVGFLIFRAFGNEFTLPINLSDLEFPAMPILFGALYFVLGFLLYLALMLATGAAFPSSKEAGGFTSVFYLLAFVPFWGFDTIRHMPDSIFTIFSTYFPLTAPTTLLVRNTLGNLSVIESIIGLLVLILSFFAAIWLAGRLFKLGALEYNSRVRLSQIFKKS